MFQSQKRRVGRDYGSFPPPRIKLATSVSTAMRAIHCVMRYDGRKKKKEAPKQEERYRRGCLPYRACIESVGAAEADMPRRRINEPPDFFSLLAIRAAGDDRGGDIRRETCYGSLRVRGYLLARSKRGSNSNGGLINATEYPRDTRFFSLPVICTRARTRSEDSQGEGWRWNKGGGG